MSSIPRTLQIFMIAFLLHVAHTERENECTQQKTEMNLSRHLRVQYKGTEQNVDCTAQVTVSKCEGKCASHTSPSGNSETGIQRECECCRETGHRSITVTMDECHIGAELLPGVRPMTSVTEPTGCACQLCRN